MTSRQWWRDAVIYQVYPRSFADSDGDGIGDLPGISARLPYLADLGVDAVWLSPFFRSPMIDGGYDVSDYRDVDPMFGTLADFDAMVNEAHRLGIRVIVDLVPNHTSSAHPWFVEALTDPRQRDRYVFRDRRAPDKPPNDWESIFGGPAWTRVHDGQWYLHLFDPAQPDLNWRNADVHREFDGILRFWLDRGVDGFRVDVAHGMAKADGLPDVGPLDGPQIARLGKDILPYFDQDEVHEIYREWRKILDSYPGERIGVAEAWASTPDRLARYVAPDELHQVFNFDYLDAPWSATELRAVIDRSLADTALVGAPTTWVLSNHDKPRHVTRLGGLDRARAATLLMLALPGSAYLYQGEELGLPQCDVPPDARQDPVWFRSGGTDEGRDGCRVPLPWSGTAPPFGFGPGGTWLPQPPSWAGLTVEAQTADPGSTLNLYRTALRLRRSLAGPLEWLDSPPDTLMFRRGQGSACAVNLGSEPVPLPRGYRRVVCASGRLDGEFLPSDTAAWLTA